MHTALRAGALLVIAGAAAGAILIFATDPIEAPKIVDKKPMALTLTSPAFTHESIIPARFTCDGESNNPPLAFRGVPENAKSLALTMEDLDVPKELKSDGVFDHWVLFNMPPTTADVDEGGSPGVGGANGRGKSNYTGPCPPPNYEPKEHRYFFRLYALDAMLNLKQGASKDEVLKAMKGHILEQVEIMGRYSRAK